MILYSSYWKSYLYRGKKNTLYVPVARHDHRVAGRNIKIVFLGGSTGNQRVTPENLTIVGLLNTKLNKDGYNFKIYNDRL